MTKKEIKNPDKAFNEINHEQNREQHPEKNSEVPIVTIDGPGGSGKGTIGLLLAKSLGWHFLDSGALYRVLAFHALQKKIDLSDESHLAILAQHLNVQFDGEIFLEGQVVTQLIREERCGNAASELAVYPAVREALLDRQRAFCRLPGLVADGRDMGTVVFREAKLKIFLEASAEERAKRRYLQLKDKGQNVTLQTLLAEIRARDERDKSRVIAPLVPAKDAVVIDTTGVAIEAVLNKVKSLVERTFI